MLGYIYVPSGVYKTDDWEGKTSRTHGTQDGRERGAKVVVDAFLAWWSYFFAEVGPDGWMDSTFVHCLLSIQYVVYVLPPCGGWSDVSCT
jgi:hypothetical protein